MTQTPSSLSSMFRGLSLRKRLLGLLLLAAGPGIAVAVYLAVNALANQREQMEGAAKRLAAVEAAQHETVVQNARVMLDTLVAALRMREVDADQCQAFLQDWVSRYPTFTSLTLLDETGEPACSDRDTELPYDPARQDFFERARSERDFVVGEYTMGRTGKPLIVAARPILDESSAFVGAVAVGIDLRWLEFLSGRIDLPQGSTVTAMNGRGEVLHHQAVGAEEGVDTVPPPDVRQAMAVVSAGAGRGATASAGERVYGFQRTETGDLIVAVGMPRYHQFVKYGAALRDTLAAPLAILVLALLMAAYASEALVTRWVRRLTDAASRMAAGDLDVRTEVPHSRYEIGRLAAAFDRMAASVQRSQERLRALVRQRQMLLREINHRTKNNMQLIASFLRLRSRGVADEGARRALADATDRISTLAEIYRLLYARPDEQPAADDVIRLGEYLRDFYASPTCRIELDVSSVELSPDELVSVGLAMNEFLANACKHAFRDGAAGTVKVRLAEAEGTVHLAVADDGVGLPEDFSVLGHPGSLGLKMVHGTAAQLGGRFEVERRGAWKSFHLRFPRQASASPEGAHDGGALVHGGEQSFPLTT